MIDKERIAQAKSHPIKEIAASLGVDVGKDNKAYCFGGHDSATKSLTFYPNTNSFHCFGCGKSGDTIGLVRAIKQCSFKGALDHILGVAPDQRPPATLQAAQRAVTGIGEHYADIYEFFIQLLPHPDANHYLVADRRLSLHVLKDNNIRAIDSEQSWHYRDKFIAAFPEDRLVSSGVLVPNKEKPGNHLFFYQCCTVIPFYRDGRIVYLQGLVRQDLRDRCGKTRNLPGIIHPSIYFPQTVASYNTEKDVIHVVEGVIDVLSVLTMNYKAIGLVSAVIKEYTDFDRVKGFHIAVIGDKDTAGFEAKLNILEYLIRKAYMVQSISITDLSMAILKEAPAEIKDVNDILKTYMKRNDGAKAR
jgi:DNA primase